MQAFANFRVAVRPCVLPDGREGGRGRRRATGIDAVEYIAAARRPSSSEPAKVQLRLPTAVPCSARSAALLLRQIRPRRKREL
jgi:hypothetical protein